MLTRLRTPLLLIFCLSLAARAGPSGRRAGEVAPSPGTKTVAKAYGAMLLGTAGPLLVGSAFLDRQGRTHEIVGNLLIAGGIFVGPSAGQFYAQSYAPGSICMGMRAGGAAMLLSGLSAIVTSEGDGVDVLLVFGGIGTFWAGGLYSLVDTWFAVDRYRKRDPEFGFIPTLTPGKGEIRPGALAWMRF